ncbi:MAG: hypothetical protein HOI80_04415 [Alphaproteobacteria bacterium]|jgi:hypothetical protein|nr:hypothetical protein [Alphaproteobacteria bacterium]MBT5389831.1 hypothetical protein [Alphaproteobacteria bacterium]MBT5540085.1 hypothetical protein [Alphaproteobacteria bacterium]MBT5654727.1 hypothetical protein [Alphaproteobacteria bacterium]
MGKIKFFIWLVFLIVVGSVWFFSPSKDVTPTTSEECAQKYASSLVHKCICKFKVEQPCKSIDLDAEGNKDLDAEGKCQVHFLQKCLYPNDPDAKVGNGDWGEFTCCVHGNCAPHQKCGM